MPSFIRTKQDEDRWSSAKSIVRRQYPKLSESDDAFWKITTSIYKKINSNKLNKRASSPEEVNGLMRNYFRLRKLASAEKKSGGVGRFVTGATTGILATPIMGTAGGAAGAGLGAGITALVNVLRLRRGKAPLPVDGGAGIGMAAGSGIGGLTGLVGGYKLGGKIYDAL